MLWANKEISTQRLTAGSYSENEFWIMCRYEPVEFRNYNLKANHITYTMFCDKEDIQVSDRIIHDEETFVVLGIQKFSDQMWVHYEVQMRWVATEFHSTVVHNSALARNTTYDPVLQEFTYPSQKDYASWVYISVLLDPIESSKSSYIKILDPGKLEEIDYVMTVEKDVVIDKTDRILDESTRVDNVSPGTYYEVLRIVPQPAQTLVGLRKMMSNY